METGANVKIKGFSGTEIQYENVPKVWLAAPESTDDDPVLVPFTYGEALDNVEVVPDFSQGDMVVTMPAGYLARSAVAKKPLDLIPEHIKKGIDIAGIVGEYAGEGGGSVKFAMGTIKASAKTVITHGLGATPDIIIYFDSMGAYYKSAAVLFAGFSTALANAIGKKFTIVGTTNNASTPVVSVSSYSTAIDTNSGSSYFIHSANENTFTVNATSGNQYYGGTWYAFAGLV